MYKIVVSNLGYDSHTISGLDGKVGEDLQELANEIFDSMPYNDDGKIYIDDYKIIYTNFSPSEKDFNSDGICDIIQTIDIDRAIYIEKI